MIGLSGIAYCLPETRLSLEDLERLGQLDTPAERLRGLGFTHARVSDVPAVTLAQHAIGRLIASAAVAPESIDALFHAGAIPESHVVSGRPSTVLEGFNYPAAQLQYELGLERAVATGVSQVGCTGLSTAVRLAADFLAANPGAARVIASSADVLPPGARREFIYNVISDGACAVLVERDAPRNRILAHRHVTKGYYWDATTSKNEIIAAYFPTSERLIRSTLGAAGLSAADVDWVIPHNVSLTSWEILLSLVGIGRDRLFADNIADKGHVIAADNFVNLKDAADRGLLEPGDRLLLVNFGFGANWTCTLLEH
jgi:3-oxoacyl-[acyl-carrier-protein] synthase-3